MHFEGTSAVENLSTGGAVVTEAAKEMSTFNVIPHIRPASVREHLADGAEVLVAFRILREELVEVRRLPDASEVGTCGAT